MSYTWYRGPAPTPYKTTDGISCHLVGSIPKDYWLSKAIVDFYPEKNFPGIDPTGTREWKDAFEALGRFNLIGHPSLWLMEGDALVIPKRYDDLLRGLKSGDLAYEEPEIPASEAKALARPIKKSLKPGRELIHMFLCGGALQTSGVGWRGPWPSYNVRRHFHGGVDLAGGAEIMRWLLMSPVWGRVVWVRRGGGYGNYLLIEIDADNDGTGDGWYLLMAHFDEILVTAGERLIKGETPLAHVGTTGQSTGPHIHAELLKSDRLGDTENIEQHYDLVIVKTPQAAREWVRARYAA